MKAYPSFDGVYIFVVWQFLYNLLRINLYEKAYSYKKQVIFDLMVLKCDESGLIFLSAWYYKRVGLDCNGNYVLDAGYWILDTGCSMPAKQSVG